MRGHCVQCAQDRQTGWTFDVVVLCEMAIRAGQYTIKSNAICVSEQMKWQRDRCIIVVCGEDLIKSVCGRLLWIRLWPSFGIFDGGLALHFVHTHTHSTRHGAVESGAEDSHQLTDYNTGLQQLSTPTENFDYYFEIHAKSFTVCIELNCGERHSLNIH